MKEIENTDFLKNKKILLVEDSFDTQFILKMLLEDVGVEVSCVDTGTDAVELLVNNVTSFDLCLIDVQLPGISGFEVAKLLRNNNYKGILIAMTARCLLNDYEASIYAGFNGYISKSAGKDNFLKTINLFTSLAHKETLLIEDLEIEFDLQPIKLEKEYLYSLKESSKVLQVALRNSDFGKARMLLEIFRSGKAFGFPKVTEAANNLLAQLEENSVESIESDEVRLICESF